MGVPGFRRPWVAIDVQLLVRLTFATDVPCFVKLLSDMDVLCCVRLLFMVALLRS